MTRAYASWGNYPVPQRQEIHRMFWRDEPLPETPNGSSLLPYGLGRSYGDSCLNDGGVLVDTTALDHFIELDEDDGLLRCEAGVSLASVLALLARRGWFPPVTPGTKYVTLGGAIANDVHGKNHHKVGTLGRHVTRFGLLRSDGRQYVCSADENEGLFRATIGGLGLTGVILWVELRMRRIGSEFIDLESVRFDNLGEFFALARSSDKGFDYTVAWIDCMARGSELGRGLFLRGNHAAATARRPPPPRTTPKRRLPFYFPEFVLNRTSLRLFNALYYRKQWSRLSRRTVHYDPFFYPLDSIADWNLLYGRRGFMQYQCVVPGGSAADSVSGMLERISSRGEGSFLAVLKIFGDMPSPGILSFPRPGVTLALDFPNRGPTTHDLLESLDGIVREHGGRVYPAKDARMSGASFRQFFPEWRALSEYVDPRFSSSFWRRVTADAEAGR